MEIKNKVAIVTGASSGIGRATAKLLSQKGAKIAIAARSTEKLQSLARQLDHDAFVIHVDMTNEKDIREMVRKAYDHYGRIDILVNNAGQGYDSTVEDMDIRTYEYIFHLNVVGPVIAMQQVIPIMRKQKEGSIISISSGTALMALPGMAGYSSMKRALVGISLTAREELRDDHINVSVIYPYITATDFEKNTIKTERRQEREDDDGRNLPAGDPPEYVAKLILETIKTGKSEIVAHEWMNNR